MELEKRKLEACGVLLTGLINGPLRNQDPEIVMAFLREEIEKICQHGYPDHAPIRQDVCAMTQEFVDRFDSKLRGAQKHDESDKKYF